MELSKPSFPKQADVVICGAGPVGLLAACLLGKYEIKTVLVEKNEIPYQMPRAIALDDETLRILQTIGLDVEFKKIAKKADGLELCSPKGKPLFTITKKAISGKDASFLFYSPALEALLRKQVETYNTVSSFYNCELLEIQEKETLHNLVYFKKNNHIIQSKYIIACDGANSQIRKKKNFVWQDYLYTATNLKIDLKLNNTLEYTSYIKKFIGPKGRAYVFLDSWQKHKRIEFTLSNHPKRSLEKYKTYLSDILNTKEFSIIHQAVYQFKSGMAKHWFRNNIALAGDAAHLMPPYIGQGMCAGFRDVQNLCSKIMLVEKRNFSPKLLHTYRQERRPHVRFVIFLTIVIGLLFTSPLRKTLYLITLFLPKTLHHFEAPPIKLKEGFLGKTPMLDQIINVLKFKSRNLLNGHLFPQNEVLNSKYQKIDSDQALQDGFNLILFIENKPDDLFTRTNPVLSKVLHSLNIKVVPIHLNQTENLFTENDLIDLGLFKLWFASHQQNVLIIRPDKYIFDSKAVKKESTKEVISMIKPLIELVNNPT